MKFALVMLFKKSTREEDIFEDNNQNKNILSITVKEDILPIKIKDWYFTITIKSCANVLIPIWISDIFHSDGVTAYLLTFT